jgi:hypothetical protein
MPTDWLFYSMTLPLSIAAIIGVAALPFGLWRSLLGTAYSTIGARPYIVGYVSSLIGLLLLSFVSSYFGFNGRVAGSLLSETQRWTVVPGWTIYIAVLSLIFVLPLLGLVGVPVSAFLLKRGRFDFRYIISTLAIFWLMFAFLVWLFPSNEWHRTHRLESFMSILRSILPGMVLVAFPFAVGIRWATHRNRVVRS